MTRKKPKEKLKGTKTKEREIVIHLKGVKETRNFIRYEERSGDIEPVICRGNIYISKHWLGGEFPKDIQIVVRIK